MSDPRFLRVSLDDPATRARMLRSGVIWKFSNFWQTAVDAIRAGEVPLSECKDVPPQVVAFLQRDVAAQ